MRSRPGRLRVIGGRLRGRRLAAPAGGLVRPTADRVREALFDVLGERVVESRFLDLYAGTGAVGIEALSRGARSATFVERDRGAVDLIRDNLRLAGESLGESEASNATARVLWMDVLSALAELEREAARFDLVFLDPPYGGGELDRGLRLLDRSGVLEAGCVAVAEHDARDAPPASAGLRPTRTIGYGRVALTLYRVGVDSTSRSIDTPRAGR